MKAQDELTAVFMTERELFVALNALAAASVSVAREIMAAEIPSEGRVLSPLRAEHGELRALIRKLRDA